jgi:ATP-binding cassette subfamily C protein LapB
VIGRVASGKSTLGRVLCGLYQPTAAQMLVDGSTAASTAPQTCARPSASSRRTAALFTGSIKDNLALGPARRATTALARGAAHGRCRSVPSARRRAVSTARWASTGSRLSGGQRSFLSLARASSALRS